jgi:hypothetical protein
MKKFLTASAITLTFAVLLTGCTGVVEAPKTDTKTNSPTQDLTSVIAPPEVVETVTSISGWVNESPVDPASISNQNSTFSNSNNGCQLVINSSLLSPADPKEENDAVLSDNAIEAFIFPSLVEDAMSDRKAVSVKNTDGDNIDFTRVIYAPTSYFNPESVTGTSTHEVAKKGAIAARVFNQQFIIEKDGTIPSEADRDTEEMKTTAVPIPELYTETVRPQVIILYLCDEAAFNEDEYNTLMDTISVTIPFKASKLEL